MIDRAVAAGPANRLGKWVAVEHDGLQIAARLNGELADVAFGAVKILVVGKKDEQTVDAAVVVVVVVSSTDAAELEHLAAAAGFGSSPRHQTGGAFESRTAAHALDQSMPLGTAESLAGTQDTATGSALWKALAGCLMLLLSGIQEQDLAQLLEMNQPHAATDCGAQ